MHVCQELSAYCHSKLNYPANVIVLILSNLIFYFFSRVTFTEFMLILWSYYTALCALLVNLLKQVTEDAGVFR